MFPVVFCGQVCSDSRDRRCVCSINCIQNYITWSTGEPDVVHIKSREAIQIMQCNHITLHYIPCTLKQASAVVTQTLFRNLN